MATFNRFRKSLTSLTCAALLVLGLGLKPEAAVALPITYVHEGSFSGGTLDGVALSPALFTITANADTDGVTSCGGGCLFNDHTSVSIDIQGLGVFDFLSSTRTFINGTLVGFSRGGLNGLDLFNGPRDDALMGYDLASSIGPVGGLAEIIQWGLSDVNTTGGVLVLDNFETDAQFSATVSAVPLPASLGLLLAGLGGLGVARRRR